MVPIDSLKSSLRNHAFMRFVFNRHGHIVTPFEGNWNCLDGEQFTSLNDPDIKAIHYTAMRYQPQIPYAVKRLEKTGKSHWFDGQPATHWRKDLVDLFDELLREAEENGFPVSKYCSEPVYGPYKKASVAGSGKPKSDQHVYG
jgi:hypothetical protein